MGLTGWATRGAANLSRLWAAAGATCAAALVAGGAAAQSIGQSAPAQLDLQAPVTQVARQVVDLHHFMLYIITGITLFVLGLLVAVVVRYNRAANPKPATFTHNTSLEIFWTAAPVVILIAIAFPSVKLLQLQEDFSKVEPDIVIKTTGHQWYWNYEYPDLDIDFDSLMLGKGVAEMNEEVRQELADYGYPERAWKLATDTAVIVPVNKTVLLQVTAADVIHAWAIPAFGVKADGVPGRLNQTWFNVEQEGVYFGQCSELCGRDHSFMPITVKAVSQEEYDSWVACVQEADVYTCPTPTMNEILERIAANEDGAADGGAVEMADASPLSLVPAAE